jgi:hypothetical protein
VAEGGFPHSEILGSKLVRSSPRLIAAYHVLHRLSAPRHPPDALKALDRSHDRCPVMTDSRSCPSPSSTVTIKTGSRSFRTRCLMLAERTRVRRSRSDPGTFPLHDVRYPQPPAIASMVRSSLIQTTLDRTATLALKPWAGEGGGAGRDRTDDLMLAKHALSQLSYSPVGRRSAARSPSPDPGGPGTTRTSDLTLIRGAL